MTAAPVAGKRAPIPPGPGDRQSSATAEGGRATLCAQRARGEAPMMAGPETGEQQALQAMAAARLARRPRAGDRHAQGRVRAGTADQGRVRPAGRPGSRRGPTRTWPPSPPTSPPGGQKPGLCRSPPGETGQRAPAQGARTRDRGGRGRGHAVHRGGDGDGAPPVVGLVGVVRPARRGRAGCAAHVLVLGRDDIEGSTPRVRRRARAVRPLPTRRRTARRIHRTGRRGDAALLEYAIG